jgi:hypothetical protein
VSTRSHLPLAPVERFAFATKVKDPFVYGCVEIAFGIVSAYQTAATKLNVNLSIVILLTAAYLIGRGLEHLFEGYFKELAALGDSPP